MTNIEQIIEAVTQVTGVSYDAMKSVSKKREIVEARFCCMAIWREEEPRIKESEIAPYFRRDRTTIIHALQTAADLLHCDKSFRNKYEKCYRAYCDEEQRHLNFDSYSRSMLEMQSNLM
jgi:chromosomal replication initiation ATPase DnaA